MLYPLGKEKVDLHIHSLHSGDGEHSVEKIMTLCKQSGIGTIAITDHNSVQGVDEAIILGKQLEVRVISGIEIDCCHKGINLHLLGYFINHKSTDFLDLQKAIFDLELSTLAEELEKLRLLGIHVDEIKIREKSTGLISPIEFIAEVALADPRNLTVEILKPYRPGAARSDMPYVNFYWDLCSQGKPAYVPIEYMNLKNAISLVKDNGGIPVIAHPAQNLKDLNLIDDIIAAGVEGIEVFSNYHSADQVDFFHKKALEKKLIITCGSDFHGKYKPAIKLGQFGYYNETHISQKSLIQQLLDKHDESSP